MAAGPFLTGDQGQSTDQPLAPLIPAVPVYDGTPEGLVATVGAMVEAVNRLTGNGPPDNNTDPNKSFSFKVKQQSKKDAKKKNKQRFVEVARSLKEVTVTDPNSGASVTYEDIVKLTMQDTVTGETWEWTQ
jgi:hypothetical protein